MEDDKVVILRNRVATLEFQVKALQAKRDEECSLCRDVTEAKLEKSCGESGQVTIVDARRAVCGQ